MDNQEQNYDNGGWQSSGQQGTFDANQSPAQDNGVYYDQSQNNNSYYDQQQDHGFTQTNDSFNSVNNSGYNNYVPEPEEGPGYAIAGMVCGILSILLCCCSFYISGALSIAGLILSIIVLRGDKPGRGMAIAGMICSVIGLVMALFLIVLQIYMLSHPGYRQSLMDMYRSYGIQP